MKIEFRKACLEDAEIYFKWTNDDLVRLNSFEQRKISFEEHVSWFKGKLSSSDCFFYFFTLEQEPIGQVRIDRNTNETVIGISIDVQYRGKNLGAAMLRLACNDYFSKFPEAKIIAYIKEGNIPSYRIFKEANFANDEAVLVKGSSSIKLSRTKK